MYSFHNINATLIVELVPCIDHPGYTYNEESQSCVCYHHNVRCSDDGNEIKRGYWFGSIVSKAITSLCPNHYCEFTNCKQTSEGYFKLPNTINTQCIKGGGTGPAGPVLAGPLFQRASKTFVQTKKQMHGKQILILATRT